jgi:hypothetical protein
LNLALFLTIQMVCRRLMIAAVIVTLLWGDQFKSHNFQISSIEVNCDVKFKQPANHDQSLIANWHSKKIWNEVSTCLLQKLHMEGMTQPLVIKFSFVGNFSCINLHTWNDLEGGMSAFQISLAQCNSCTSGSLKS